LDFGFKPDHVLTMQIACPSPSIRAARGHRLLTGIAARVSGLPGVAETALSSIRPMDGVAFREFSIPGVLLVDPVARPVQTIEWYHLTISQQSGRLAEGPLLRRTGRARQPGCRAGQRELRPDFGFPNEDAVGKQIQLHNLYSANNDLTLNTL